MTTAEEEDAAIVDPVPWWRTGALQARWDSAEGFDMGGVNALIPLHAAMAQDGTPSGTMFFLEPYGQWIEGGPHQAGFGLGFRQLHSTQSLAAPEENPKFFDEGFYVGAHLFFDRANTRSEQNIWQLTLGAEAGTRWVDLRGRYHFPIGDGKTTNYRSVTTYTQTSEGNGVQGTETLTFDTTLSLFTEGLGGWETNAAFLVPGLDRWVDLRVLAGYAAFQSETVDSLKYDTWRTGIDFRPVPAVSLSAIWNENESLFGANWVYGAGIQIPFEIGAPGAGACGTGGGFWGAIKESFRPQRPHLTNRFLEPTRSRSLPLPMQVGTSVQDIKTTATYQGTFTLPDGRVAQVSGSQTSSSSGSGSYATGATTVMAGSLQLSGGASFVTSTLASSGTTGPTGGVATGSNSGTSTNTGSTGTTGSSSTTTTGGTGTTTSTGSTTTGGTLVLSGGGTSVTIPSGTINLGSLPVGGTTTTTTTTTTTSGSTLVINGGGNSGINVIGTPVISQGGVIPVNSGGTGTLNLNPGQLITANGTISFSMNSSTFTVGGRQFTIGNLNGVSLPASVWGTLLQNLPQGDSFTLENDGSGNYSLVPES